jgi:hypothetical protein
MHDSSHFRFIAVALLLVTAVAPCIKGQGEETIKEAIRVLDAALGSEPNLAPATKDAIRQVVGALEGTVSERARSQELGERLQGLLENYSKSDEFIPRKRAFESVFKHLTFSGDVRFRFESTLDLDDQPDRYRQRVRFRLATNYNLNDELTLRTRLITGDAGDPNSPHQTLGNVFDSFDVTLDRVLLEYRPEWAPGFTTQIGKFGHPFRVNPIYGEHVWDADVQPEGAAISYRHQNAEGFLRTFEAHIGGYTVLETGGGDDVFALTAQIAAVFALSDEFEVAPSVAYYMWGDPTPDGALAILGDNQGNALVDRNGDMMVDDYLSDFGVLDIVIAVTYKGLGFPLTFAGELIWNHQAADSQDLGWSLGISAGSAQKAGDWRAYYAWQSIQRDAVFSPVAQDDFILATNHESHLVGINYMITDSIGLHLWGMVTSRDLLGATATTDSDDDQYRIRMDLNISF